MTKTLKIITLVVMALLITVTPSVAGREIFNYQKGSNTCMTINERVLFTPQGNLRPRSSLHGIFLTMPNGVSLVMNFDRAEHYPGIHMYQWTGYLGTEPHAPPFWLGKWDDGRFASPYFGEFIPPNGRPIYWFHSSNLPNYCITIYPN